MNRLLALSAAAAVACTAGRSPADTDTDTNTVPQWPQPSLLFTSPDEDGAVAEGGTLTFTVSVSNFDLTPALPVTARRRTAPPLPWLWLEPTAAAHQPGDKPNGFIGVTVDDLSDADAPRPWVTTTDLKFTLTRLPPGDSVVTAQLFWPDPDTQGRYDSLYPAVLDTVRIVVPGDDTEPPDTDSEDTDPEVP